MENDPLRVLVREMTPEERASAFITRQLTQKPVDYKGKVNRLAKAVVDWNIKKMSAEDVIYKFIGMFEKEYYAAWREHIKKEPRKILSEEERKEKRRQYQRNFRARHPGYFRELAENKKLKAQGGYYG